MSARLAAYAVCEEEGRVLLVRCADPNGAYTWSLPGGGGAHGEDPFDAVVREVAEETGCDAVVERLLGIDSRMIPGNERWVPGQGAHQNVGVFYRPRVAGGGPRPEPNGATSEPAWTPIPDVVRLRRSSLVDIGLTLARAALATDHVDPVPIGGLIQH